MAEELLDNIGSSAQGAVDAAQQRTQAAYEEARAKAQAALEALPTPAELISSIKTPELPTADQIIEQIIPGQMSNTDLINFLAPATVRLPGLNVNTILQIGFATQYREILARVDTPEERQELVDRYYGEFLDKNKETIERGIASIKSKYQNAQKKLDNLLERAQNGIARIANPPVVGTAAPNPTRTLQDYIDLKQQAENELATISDDLIQLILVAESIDWDLPTEVDILVQIVARVKTALELIPV